MLIVERKEYYSELIHNHQLAGGTVPEDPGIGPAPRCSNAAPTVSRKRKRSPAAATKHSEQLADGLQPEQDANVMSRRKENNPSMAGGSSLTETARIWRMVDEIVEPTLLAELKRSKVCALDNCPEETLQMWESSGGMPKVIPSSKIYYTDDRYS